MFAEVFTCPRSTAGIFSFSRGLGWRVLTRIICVSLTKKKKKKIDSGKLSSEYLKYTNSVLEGQWLCSWSAISSLMLQDQWLCGCHPFSCLCRSILCFWAACYCFFWTSPEVSDSQPHFSHGPFREHDEKCTPLPIRQSVSAHACTHTQFNTQFVCAHGQSCGLGLIFRNFI